MADPVTNQVAQQLTKQAAQPQSPQPVEISFHDQTRFEDALRQPGGQPADGVAETNADNNARRDDSIGDAILDGLEKMKSSHDARSERIEHQLTDPSGKELSVQECIKLQFEVMQMSMEQELTGKVADKTSQGVQTLFKNQ